MSLSAYFGGKHVIITGGSSGIGRALARQLVEWSAEVTLIARRPELLEEARVELTGLKAGAKVHVLPLDIADDGKVVVKVGEHIETYPADMLINNAGVAMPGRFLETESSEYRRQMDINYFGMVHMCRAVVPQLIERGGGHICNVGSLLSVMGIYGYSAYAATKFAMQGFSECVRAELKPYGIRVSILQPPDTDTPQHAAELEHLPAETKAIAGTVKMLSADQVAKDCLQGMEAGRFEIVPGMEGQLTVMAQRVVPSVVRWFCDSAQKKAGRAKPESSSTQGATGS